MVQRLGTVVRSLDEKLVDFKRQIEQILRNMAPGPGLDSLDDSVASATALLTDQAVNALDQHVQATLIEPNGGLFHASMSDARLRSQILAELSTQSARAAERAALASASSRGHGSIAGAAGGAAFDSEQSLLAATRHGGTFRRLAVAENKDAASSLAAMAGDPLDVAPTELVCDGAEPVLCYEGGNLPLTQIAIDLIERRRDYADFASRVFTRTDVAWTPLAAPPPFESEPFTFEALARAPQVTQIL
jgi:hypothetical protein